MIRFITVGAGIVSLSSLFILFLLQRNIQTAISARELKQKQLELEIKQYKSSEEKIQELQSKLGYISSITKNEPPYDVYYEILKKHFTVSTDSGSLKNVHIDKSLTTDVLLTFPDILALSKFLDYAESSDFQKDFETISLGAIALSDAQSKELLVSINVTFKKEYR